MRKFIFDAQLVEKIFETIARTGNPELEEKRKQVQSDYDYIKDKLSAEWLALSISDDEISHPRYTALAPNELIELTSQVISAIMAFVDSTCEYYRVVGKQRMLTDDEKKIGRDLSELLNQVQEINAKKTS